MTPAEIDRRRDALGWTKSQLAREARASYSSTRHLIAGRFRDGPGRDDLIALLVAAIERGEREERARAAFRGDAP